MSTKVVALVIATMVCVTVLLAARMLDNPSPEAPPAAVDLCPPRATYC